MRNLYQAFKESRRLNKKRGFTLIELLVVIAIIAILAAIAIPQFAKYRVRAYNGAAESDLRNIRTTMESIYADFQSYGNFSVGPATNSLNISATSPTGAPITENISLSSGVSAGIDSKNVEFTAASAHRDGDREFCIDSDISNIWWKTKPRGQTLATIPTSNGTAGDNECTGYNNRL